MNYKGMNMPEILEAVAMDTEKIWKKEPYEQDFKGDLELYVICAWYDVVWPLGKADYIKDRSIINQVVIPYVREHATLE